MRSLIVAAHRKGGECDHGYMREARVGLEQTREGEAVHPGQRNVDQNEIRQHARERTLRLFRIGHALGLESFDLEQFPDELQVDRIVVDDENMSAHFQDR